MLPKCSVSPIYTNPVDVSSGITYNVRMPRKPTPHTKSVQIRLTQEELGRLVQLSDFSRVTMSQWLRAQIHMRWEEIYRTVKAAR